MRAEYCFTVGDLETTGFGKLDRVIEIALLRFDPHGNLVDEINTLINPGRDLGPTHVHGITASEVRDAPHFEDIAGDLFKLLSGAVFVAHNVAFDIRMLGLEVERIGETVPDAMRLCTLQMARHQIPEVSARQLSAYCEHLKIPLKAHRAYDDALAVHALLGECMRRSTTTGIAWTDFLQGSVDVWPTRPGGGRFVSRNEAAERLLESNAYLATLINRLPRSTVDGDAIPYLALLDQILSDRRIAPNESDSLMGLARDLGISSDRVMTVHRDFFKTLAGTAWADGVISESETKDLRLVAELLCIPTGEVDGLMSLARGIQSNSSTEPGVTLSGKTICFTGQFQCLIGGTLPTREYAQSVAQSKGMLIKDGVTKKLDFLVTADPDSMSGKARKAREYGTKILAEQVFWQMMGVRTD